MSNANEKTPNRAGAGNVISMPDRTDIDLAAAEWLMRLENDDVTATDIQAFHGWRGQSEHHAQAFEAAAQLWNSLDLLDELNDHAAASEAQSAHTPTWGGLSRRSAMAAAASLVVFVGAGTILYGTVFSERDYRERHATAIGEQKTVDLPDGSVIEINTNSAIEIAYTDDARRVSLLHGEAYFDVSPDQERPFSVHAEDRVITAVGTEFMVRLKEKIVDVVVAEGRVALAIDPSATTSEARTQNNPVTAAKPLLELTAGQTAAFDEKVESLDHVEPDVMRRRLSWRNGMLAFAGEPLGYVVADVSRYTQTVIEIEDDALRTLPVAGYFKAGEVEAMFEALELMGGVEVERVNETTVRLKQASPE